MKKNLTYLLGVIALAVTTFSCSTKKPSKPVLRSINLSCVAYKSYVVGDHLLDTATTSVSLTGYYSNGASETFAFSDVSFTLKSNGEEYDPFNALTTGGSYTLKAKKDGVTSNSYNFTVSEEHIYVSSIEYVGEDVIGVNRPSQFTLTVNPSNNTEQMLFTSSNENIATVNQTGLNTFEVIGYQKGDTVLTFSAKASASEGDNIVINHDLTVEDNYITDFTVAGPSVTSIESDIQIHLGVEPEDFTVEVSAVSLNPSVATVEKVSDVLFNVTGVTAGETDIRFSTHKSSSEVIEKEFHVQVQNIARTKIRQTYKDFSKKNVYTVSSCPTIGDAKLLVIPVWFNDSNTFIKEACKEDVRQDIYSAFFGSEDDTGWHSVASFYNEESQNKLNITGTVSDWYSVNKNASAYAEDYESTQTQSLVGSAINWYFSNHTDSRLDYDCDEDGYLDGVMLIYGAPDYITHPYGEKKENLWAYVSCIPVSPIISNPVASAFMWASYDFMYSKTLAKERTGFKYGYGDTSHCLLDAHTYIHEMGHIFGLEDYYDYAGLTSYTGRYSMQDYNVCGHEGFSNLALGWADPFIPTTSCEITLNDFQSSHELILLTPEWNSYDSPFDEYLLLELYSPTGLNYQDVSYNYHKTGTAPNAVGIRLWHVDAMLFKASGNSGTFTSDTNLGRINNAFNNTSKTKAEGGRDCYAKPVSTYQEYSMLHLIRNNVLETYHTNNIFKASDLFYSDNTFTMNAYQSQFLKGTRLDFNKYLGWSFKVNSINDYGTGQYSASISLTKSL